jgi:adenylate cyclase
MSTEATQPIQLRDLDRCFRGYVPATIATCSPEGIPNITFLSVVHRIGDDQIALSFQFSNKTHQNIQAHPHAQLLVIDPATMVQYRIDVRYQRTEQSGPVFERMRTNLVAVASQVGMTGAFRLRGADIYSVLGIEQLAHDLDLSDPEPPPADFVAALETLSQRIAGCDELDALLDTTVIGLAELFDYPCSMVLFADGSGTRLYTVASRGFSESGVGAEVPFGEGLIGTAALDQRPVRITNMRREEIMAGAVRRSARERGHPVESGREIALPGLAEMQSQLAVPILGRDQTLGVLCVQSDRTARFTLVDEQALSTVARYLAISILLLGLGAGSAGDLPAARAYARQPKGERRVKIQHHASDDSIFVDDQYLIKGVPGRILFRILSVHERDGRVDFTTKELRVDEALRLGGYRDNLDARLILLRRRLEERSDALRIVKTGRGRFRLELRRPFGLVSGR